jgi:hypothetical protein
MTAIGREIRRPEPSLDALRADLLRPWPRVGIRKILGIVLVVGAFAWGAEGTRVSPGELVDGVPNIVQFVRRMFPPEFETERQTLRTPAVEVLGLSIPRVRFSGVSFPFPTIIHAIIETIQIAIIGTVLAIVTSAPFAILAARHAGRAVRGLQRPGVVSPEVRVGGPPLRIVTMNTGKCDGPYAARMRWLTAELRNLDPTSSPAPSDHFGVATTLVC